MKPRIAILISGGGSNMVALVSAMQSGQIDATPSVVISNQPTAGGVLKAYDMGVNTTVVDHTYFSGDKVAFENEMHNVLVENDTHFVCLAGFMRVLSKSFVDKWQGKLLNIHPSLLPKYKGLDTHQRALDAGDDVAGCSVHQVTAELDDGPIIEQVSVPILPNDTAETLAARVLVEEHKLYPKALDKYLQSTPIT